MQRLLIFLILIISGAAVQGQDVWTLDDCLKYAEENNIALKRQGLQTDLYKTDLQSSKAAVLPNLNFQSGGSMNFGRSVDPVTNTITFNQNISNYYNLSSSLALFNGFTRLNRISASRFLYSMGIAREEQQKNLLNSNIVNAYYSLLLAKGVVRTAGDQLEVSKQQLHVVEVLVETGAESKTTLLEMRSQVSFDKLLLTQAASNERVALEELRYLLQLDPLADFDISEDIPLSTISADDFSSSDSVYIRSRSVLPRVKALEYQVDARRKELAATIGQSMPSLGMSAGWGTGYYNALVEGQTSTPFMTQLKNNNSQSLGLNLSIPIFSRWFYRSNIKRAKINLADANLQLEQEYNALFQEINAACLELVSLKDEFISSRDNLEFNKQSFNAVDKKFRTGLASATELAEARRQLFSAEVTLLRTKLQYDLKQRIIRFYSTGTWDFI
jgi:outer membrane protein